MNIFIIQQRCWHVFVFAYSHTGVNLPIISQNLKYLDETYFQHALSNIKTAKMSTFPAVHCLQNISLVT